MSDGLFFTGVVLKNNRNLIEEEATRRQLAIQEEELAIRREEFAQRRKDARSKGNEFERGLISSKNLYDNLSGGLTSLNNAVLQGRGNTLK